MADESSIRQDGQRKMMQQKIYEVSNILWYPLGTRYVDGIMPYHYGLAGTELKKDHLVYSNVHQENLRYEGSLLVTDGINDLIWGNLSATGNKRTELGVAVVDVQKGQYCWIRVRF